MVQDVEAHHGVDRAIPEGKLLGVRHGVVPGHRQQLRGDPAQVGTMEARVLREEPRPCSHLHHSRASGQGIEKDLEPVPVDLLQYRPVAPDAAMLEQAVVVKTQGEASVDASPRLRASRARSKARLTAPAARPGKIPGGR
jgi:hypothetical protein